MAKGYDDIPALHHVFLRRVGVDFAATAPVMQFKALFPDFNIPTDTATWEIELGSTGLSPFVAPGAPAPLVGIDGLSSGTAKVAYWKEKAFLDEVLLNNLRRVGTLEADNGARLLGRQLQKITYRSQRRKEWMCAKAIVDGQFTYIAPGNAGRFTVNYGRPAQNALTLVADRKWGTGGQRNPVEDILDVKVFMSDTYGITPQTMTMNSSTLRLLLLDVKIQDLLKSSAFGQGDLFADPARVLGSLFGLGNIAINDASYEVDAWVAGVNGTTITLDNSADMEVGGDLFVNRAVDRFKGEKRKIVAVDARQGTVTIDKAFSTAPVAGRDKVAMSRKFVDDNKVSFTTPTFNGMPIGEFYNAPFGIPAHFGMFTDSETEWDPDGVYLRVQDKGLPVIYHPQTTFVLTVA